MISPELQAKLSILRQKAADGSMTLEDQREGVAYLRGERKGAAQSADSARRKKAKKEVKSADELLKELGI